MGMSEDEFWDMTPRAFFNAVEGFTSLRRTDLEIQRLQTLFFVNCWAKKPISDPKQLWKYPWEMEHKKIDVEAQRKRAKRAAEKIERIERRGKTEEL